MTIARFGDGSLWVHSPTLPTEPLLAEIARLGPVRFLIAPSKLHYWWIGEWKRRFPRAITYATPGVRARAHGRFASFDDDLGDDPPVGWGGDIEQVLIPTDYLTEAEFFHRSSHTLILTDLIENFERDRVTCWHMQLLLILGGVADPDGKSPIDMRMAMFRHKTAVRAAVEKILAWRPQRIILAHGR
jgi:hypothetical protein